MAVEIGRQAARQAGALDRRLGGRACAGWLAIPGRQGDAWKAEDGQAQGHETPPIGQIFPPLGSGHRSARIRAPRGTALISRCRPRSRAERYRSGHNGADSKSDGRVIPAREFESHPLRHFSSPMSLAEPVRFLRIDVRGIDREVARRATPLRTSLHVRGLLRPRHFRELIAPWLKHDLRSQCGFAAGAARFEKLPLARVRTALNGRAIGGGGLRVASEAPQQIGAHRVKQVVVAPVSIRRPAAVPARRLRPPRLPPRDSAPPRDWARCAIHWS